MTFPTRDIEELKKSFPSLDGLATQKLLGGGFPSGDTIGTVDWGTLPEVVVEGGPWHGGAGTSGGGAIEQPDPPGGGGGSEYVDELDWGIDGLDAGGDWGDGGGSGGGPNPGGYDDWPSGSEGGNGQNSSGNPGGQGQQGELTWLNNSTPTPRPYVVRNNTANTIYAKPENNFPAGPPNVIAIPPGGTINTAIDGLNINGIVYIFVDGYGWVEVNPGNYTTNYSSLGSVEQFWGGGVLDTPPDDDAYPNPNDPDPEHGISGWQDLFDAL